MIANRLPRAAIARYRVPLIILGVFLGYVVAAMLPATKSRAGLDLAAFGRLPVRVNSRVQPLDSAARIGLLQIRGSVTVPHEQTGAWHIWSRGLSATEWLSEVLMNPDAADRRRIFPLRQQGLITLLRLEPSGRTAPHYYAFTDLQPTLEELGKQAFRIIKKKPGDRLSWEVECLNLRNTIVIYERLKNSLQPNSYLQQEARGRPVAYDFAALLKQYQGDLKAGVAAAVGKEHGKAARLDAATEERMRTFARPFLAVSAAAMLSIVPAANAQSSSDGWQNVGSSMVETARTGQVPLPVTYFARMSSGLTQSRPDDFNEAVSSYRTWLLSHRSGSETGKARLEFFYNRFQPFLRALSIYLVVLVLGVAAVWRRSAVLYRSATLLGVLAFTLHTMGLLFEMMLEGRPPVTNVYSLIIFIGWGAVLGGGAAERFWRRGYGTFAAASFGLLALGAAHGLAPGGVNEIVRSVVTPTFCAAMILMLMACQFGTNSREPAAQPVAQLPRRRPQRATT